MLSKYAFWELCSYTTPLSEEDRQKSTTWAERVAFADETPRGVLNHIRAVRNYKLSQLRKGMMSLSSAETYGFTLIRKHRSKEYEDGHDRRYRAFMEPVYDGDWEKYPAFRYEDFGITGMYFDHNPAGLKFICYLDETPEEFLPMINKFLNVEFKESRKEVPEKK